LQNAIIQLAVPLIPVVLLFCRYMNEVSSFPGSKSENLNITLVGMSATIPNLELLALWLDAEYFQTDYRCSVGFLNVVCSDYYIAIIS